MAEAPLIIPSPTVEDYLSRNDRRTAILCTATMNFVGYFMALGDTQAVAEDKVGQLSDELRTRLYQFTLGRTQPMLDDIQASTLPFMDQAAKDYIIAQLTVV